MDIVSKNGNLLLNIGPPGRTGPSLRKTLPFSGKSGIGSDKRRGRLRRPALEKFGKRPHLVADGQFSDSVKRNSPCGHPLHGEWRRALCRCSQGDPLGRIPFYPAERAGEDSQFRGLIRSVEVPGFRRQLHLDQGSGGPACQDGRPSRKFPIVFKILMG